MKEAQTFPTMQQQILTGIHSWHDGTTDNKTYQDHTLAAFEQCQLG